MLATRHFSQHPQAPSQSRARWRLRHHSPLQPRHRWPTTLPAPASPHFADICSRTHQRCPFRLLDRPYFSLDGRTYAANRWAPASNGNVGNRRGLRTFPTVTNASRVEHCARLASAKRPGLTCTCFSSFSSFPPPTPPTPPTPPYADPPSSRPAPPPSTPAAPWSDDDFASQPTSSLPSLPLLSLPQVDALLNFLGQIDTPLTNLPLFSPSAATTGGITFPQLPQLLPQLSPQLDSQLLGLLLPQQVKLWMDRVSHDANLYFELTQLSELQEFNKGEHIVIIIIIIYHP
eukprot:g60954.t1